MRYGCKEDLEAFCRKLKMTACPHCKLFGQLILHGYLRGYSEKHANLKVIRGKRFFCSNRNRRKGCGKTFSLLLPDFIKKFTLSAASLWTYFKTLLAGYSKKKAFESLCLPFTIATAYRLWKKLVLAQPELRTYLTQITAPPPMQCLSEPLLQTITHLQAAFPEVPCPISAFQQHFQVSFF